MQMELAALYVRLGRFPEAETILKHLSAAFQDAADPESLERAVECTRMLGEVREGVGDDRGHLETLMHAKTLQETIVARSKGDPEVSHRQRRLLAETCIDIADRMATRHDAGSATSHYEEALKHDEGNLAAMSALAKLKLNLEDTEGCQAMCVRILREDEGNEEASLMLAELMFRKGHAETAIYHFQDLLEKNPGNYRALAQLVQLLRRAGRLDEASRFLKTAETASDDAAHRAGFHFAKGLERRHLGETQEALGHLNRCRADHEWGADAAYEMVDIYISPENQSMWQYDENRKDASQAAEHVRAAEHLLAEVRQRREPKHTVLESYVHMARGTKQGYEKAFEMCAEIVNEDHDNVPALLAVALCHMLEKQPTKAKNTLKRVAKLPYNAAEAEEFERAWLTSAELAMEGGSWTRHRISVRGASSTTGAASRRGDCWGRCASASRVSRMRRRASRGRGYTAEGRIPRWDSGSVSRCSSPSGWWIASTCARRCSRNIPRIQRYEKISCSKRRWQSNPRKAESNSNDTPRLGARVSPLRVVARRASVQLVVGGGGAQRRSKVRYGRRGWGHLGD